jgi:hypothetical protein
MVVAEAAIVMETGNAGVIVTFAFCVLLHPVPGSAVTVYTVVAVGLAVTDELAVEGVPAPAGNPAVPDGAAVQL